MIRKTGIAVALAVSLTMTGNVFAQDHNDHGRNDQRDSRDHRDGPGDRHNNRGPGAGPNHSYHRGDRLPPEEHDRRYVVNDWHDHHLKAPPRGYHWVQSGDDYVLAAVATGVIAALVLGHH